MYSSPNIIRNFKSSRLRWAEQVWQNSQMHTELEWEGMGERDPLGRRPKRRWEDKIEMDLKEVSCDAGN